MTKILPMRVENMGAASRRTHSTYFLLVLPCGGTESPKAASRSWRERNIDEDDAKATVLL